VAPILWVFPRIADWATRTLSFEREYAADAAAAHIVGRPLALATALLTLSETTERPATDLRQAKTAALCIVPSEPASGSETVSRPAITQPARAETRRGRVEAVLGDRATGQPTETHPPVEQRVAHLREIATEIEGR
jgi:heat shock protein HtpX